MGQGKTGVPGACLGDGDANGAEDCGGSGLHLDRKNGHGEE